MEENRTDIIGILSIAFTVVNAIGLLVSLVCSLSIQQWFLRIFEDFDAELPAATQLFFSVPWALWVFIAIVLLLALVAKELYL